MFFQVPIEGRLTTVTRALYGPFLEKYLSIYVRFSGRRNIFPQYYIDKTESPLFLEIIQSNM
jgi:hypothetical protein